MNAADNIRFRKQEVTPTMAEAWLQRVDPSRQRTISQMTVEKYADDQRHDRWRFTGEAIIFDSEGFLINGQHRLAAQVISQATITYLVVSGVQPAALHNIDTGRPRSVAQVLGLVGHANAARRASIARAISVATDGNSTLSVDGAERIFKKWPGVAWVLDQQGALSTSRFACAPILAAFAIAYSKVPEKIPEQWSAYISGADLKTGDPFLALRGFLAGPNRGATGLMRAALLRRCLTAIAYRIQGKTLMKCYDGVDGERFFGIGR